MKWKGQRKSRIPADGLTYIRKEANIKDQTLDVIKPQVFINEEEIKQKIWLKFQKKLRN